MVIGRAIAIPGSDATSQDALDVASVERFEDLRTHAKSLYSFLRGNGLCRALFTTVLVCLEHSSLLLMWTPRNFEVLNLLHYSPIDENGGVLGPPFPVVHNHLLCLDHVEGEVVVLAPHGQVSDLLPIGCLVIVGDQT